MPSWTLPKRSTSGVCTVMRLPHGHTVLDAVVALAEFEFCAFERLLHALEPVQERFTVRHDQAGDAAQHVGLAHRQVELAHADIDPHVAGAGVEKGIARIAEPGDVEMRGEVLIVDADIDVADADDVADVLGGAVELRLGHCRFLVSFLGDVRSRRY